MCGVPYHSADSYIAKLIKHGLRVAICEQTEDPAQAKGIVRREIVRIVTPTIGSIVNEMNPARLMNTTMSGLMFWPWQR